MPHLLPLRRHVAFLSVATLLLTVLTVLVATGAVGGSSERCQRHRAASAERASLDSGSGERVVVIGDSWSVGLGLDDTAGSWPAQLPGRVHVDGFSGSGFSAGASSCRHAQFADRAERAIGDGASLVVVAGGLNDYDQPEEAIAAGARRLLDQLSDVPVVVVGPAMAPSRAQQVPRVDAVLERVAGEYGVDYVRAYNWPLDYLDDKLHLTPEGHREFGERVAEAIADLG